jgi:hypothetical protein
MRIGIESFGGGREKGSEDGIGDERGRGDSEAQQTFSGGMSASFDGAPISFPSA